LQNQTENQTVYFPNLNGLRFIAATLVIIHHIEQFKNVFMLPGYWHKIPCIELFGKIGVVLFFVLSGFLITYLLLTEEQKRKKISVKNFYIRRVLRIWPLYFLVVFLAFAVLPQLKMFQLPGIEKEFIFSDLVLKIFLYIAFLPNLALSIFGAIPFVSQTWSIGTEEQFYLLWPVLLLIFKKHRLSIMFLIVIGYFMTNIALHSHYFETIPYIRIIQGFWKSFNINCMAIGGIFALLLFKKSIYLKYLMNTNLFYLLLLLTTTLLLMGIHLGFVHLEIYSLLFGIIILNFAANNKIKISFENRVMTYLGRISYGLYMYHPIGIVMTIYTAIQMNLSYDWFIYPLSLAFTISLAGISHKYFESYFLRNKAKFSG
jgi:peptidoglycan/LPS O-acetylase OafA/YrhL